MLYFSRVSSTCCSSPAGDGPASEYSPEKKDAMSDAYHALAQSSVRDVGLAWGVGRSFLIIDTLHLPRRSSGHTTSSAAAAWNAHMHRA